MECGWHGQHESVCVSYHPDIDEVLLSSSLIYLTSPLSLPTPSSFFHFTEMISGRTNRITSLCSLSRGSSKGDNRFNFGSTFQLCEEHFGEQDQLSTRESGLCDHGTYFNELWYLSSPSTFPFYLFSFVPSFLSFQ